MSRTKLKSPQRIADFLAPYRATLAYWSAFRNLGFDAEEIFFGFGEVSGDPNVLHLQLQTQGKTFTAMCSQLNEPRARVLKTWQRIAKLVSSSTVEERTLNYREHFTAARFTAFVVAIRAKGILIPELLHAEPGVGHA